MTTEGSLTFSKLRLSQWRQFAAVDIDFHPTLTVLTGANGVGKSTLLNILARHVGVERPYLSVPERDASGTLKYIAGLVRGGIWGLFGWRPPTKYQVGEITYSDGDTSRLSVPESVSFEYSLEMSNQKPVAGIVFSSHRTLPAYHRIPHISFQGVQPDDAFRIFVDELNHRYRGHYFGPENSLMFRIKNTIAAWAAIGEGNSVLQPNFDQRKAYLGFVDILKKVLPDSLGFINLAVRPPEVVMETRSGEFLIDAVSGGVSTLIENAALIYSCSIRSDMKGKRFVVTLDEPENHLHPALQRELFGKLTTAFPQVQFIVATHSPFIVSSLKNSNVYVLRFQEADPHIVVEQTESRRVTSEKLDYANRAGTASEILREVLGVPATIPKWVEDDLGKIVKKYETANLTDETLAQIRRDLKEAGLTELFPEALVGLSRGR